MTICMLCSETATRRGYCTSHYVKLRKSGDLPVKQLRGASLRERFEQHVDRRTAPEGCHEWTGFRSRQGYGQFAVNRGGSRYRTEVASRVAWEIVYGPVPEGMEICHSCDNPPCVRVDHLFLGTASDNALDSYRKGRRKPPTRHARGERVGLAKLTEAGVREIRRRYAAGGVSQQVLADEFGVHQTKISAVVRRKTWIHVLDEEV